MKWDVKSSIIVVLIVVVAVLAGIVIGKRSSDAPEQASRPQSEGGFVPADDGKLAKNYKQNELQKTIGKNSKFIQKCYFDLLDKKPAVTEGIVTFLIKVEEDGRISSAKATQNELGDNDLGECISAILTTFYLAPPPYGINRYISHELVFQSEETAKREAEKRLEMNKPPKVLPVTAP